LNLAGCIHGAEIAHNAKLNACFNSVLAYIMCSLNLQLKSFQLKKKKISILQAITFFESKALKLVIEKLKTNTKIWFYW